MKTTLLLCVLLAGTCVAWSKTAICIESNSDDVVGTAFVYELKEVIASSSLYQLGDSCVTSGYRTYITSVDPLKDQINSAVSLVLVKETSTDELFRSHWIVMVNTYSTKSVAGKMIAEIDRAITKLH
jgi:hypothetical protein